MSVPPKQAKHPPAFSRDGFEIKKSASAGRTTKKGHSHRPLPTQFRHDGFFFRQIAREGDFATYEHRWAGCPEPSVCYEVVRIERREGLEIKGKYYPPAEVYPKSEAWGTDGWTYTDKDAAFARLREIVESSNALTRFGQQEVE